MATSSQSVRRTLLTEREVAELFSVTPRTVRNWARAGELNRVRVGGTTRYRVDDIENLIYPVNDARPAGEPGAVTTSAGGDGRDAADGSST
jgi:excisionase family DNA binding protein